MAYEFIIKNGFISKGKSSIEGTFSLNTISATTYQNLPTDVRVTGGTYSSGTATFTNNTGGTFSVTGFSTSSSLTVGTTPITSGTVGGILFEGTGNVVQEDSNLFWDNTNKRLGIGATPSTSVRLDVRAQGTLSTDIAFRVRNSADTNNIISISSNGQFTLGLGAVTSGALAVSIGNTSSSLGVFSVTIGAFTSASLASEASLAIGYGANVTGNRGIALGLSASVTNDGGVSLGESSSVSGVKGISIGSAATVTASNSVMIGGGGVTNAIVYSNAFTNGLNGYSFFNDINSNYVINSAVIPVNNISYLSNTKNVLYLGTGIKPATTIKNGTQIYTNYRTISQASSTVGATATGTGNTKILTFSTGTDMSALTVGTRLILTNNIGEQTHTNIVSVVGLVVTVDTAMLSMPTLNANSTTVSNSTVVIVSDFHQETRNDKGDIIKLYKETSSVVAAAFVSNTSLIVDDSATYGGYTMGQVVAALKAQGLLA